MRIRYTRKNNMNTRLITVFASTIIFLLVFFILRSSLGYDFVWDDREIIVNNIHIKSINSENLLWAFTTTFSGNYLPLTWVSFMVDYNIWGLQSYGYRLTNIIIHSLNSILLMLCIFSFLRYYYKTSTNYFLLILASTTGALIFALHPLRIESVIWITERKDVLSAFFLLISFLAYFHGRFNGNSELSGTSIKNLYVVSFIFYFLSLLSKAWAITFPVVLVLVDMAIQQPGNISIKFLVESIKQKAPFIITSILFSIIAAYAQKNAGAMISWEKLTLADRVLQAGYGFNMYLVHTLYPVNLSPLYLLGKTNFLSLKFYMHFLIFTGIFIFTFLIRNKSYWPLYFFLIYFVIISPVLGFSQSGAQIMADRYTYIALMPLSFVFSWITLRIFGLIIKQKQKTVLTYAISLVYIMLLYTLASFTSRQILIWKNEETLWTHAINIDRLNYQALNNRADYRLREKLYKKSFEDYTSVLGIDTDNAYALNGRAVTRIHVGDLKGAIEDLNSALSILPTYVDALLNRGIAYHNLGNAQLARDDFQSVIGYLPEQIKAHFYLGISYFVSNQFNEAITEFTNVNHINPDFIDAIYYRGLSYIHIEDYVKAKKDFEYVMLNLDENNILYKNAEQQLKLVTMTDT